MDLYRSRIDCGENVFFNEINKYCSFFVIILPIATMGPRPDANAHPAVAATLAAGALSGVCADALMYPADALSTQYQTRGTSTLRPSALYRGFWAAAILGAPGYAVYLSTYDYFSKKTNAACAGCLAELAAGLLFVPAEVLKRRAVLGHRGYGVSQLPGTVVKMLQKGGIPTLYAGYTASVATWMPFSAIYFFCFEHFRSSLASSTSPSRSQVPCHLAAGAGAGAIAAVVTAPIDLVATRIQTGYQGARSIADVLAHVTRVEHQPLRVFFRAAPARVLWLAPQAAISIAAFHYFKQRLASP